ncbi:MAG: UDP-3-O-(3-hydroxymyristoyl)glucosamine N-acyltransferase [Betaproteobacteria bacterium]|nr:UDP-3-O-(3-hydroxymyristoyl)glucosamine N-acyltransferase [Betaproteobacteria bacterium]
MKSLTLAELVERFGCVVHECSGVAASEPLTGISTLSSAESRQISFLTNSRYFEDALTSKAGAILCSAHDAQQLAARALQSGATEVNKTLLVCRNPYATFARISQYFFEPRHDPHGRPAFAYVDATAVIHESANLFPFVYVGPGARIGARSVLYPGSFVGAAAIVGDDCLIHPNAVIREGCKLGDRCILNPGAVVGGDGFGFAPDGAENVKIPQTGGVVLGNDVELGSNASVDRGALSDTRIGEQTKIDSLVQVGHNAIVGRACFLAAGTGVAGSTEIGNRVTLAGQVGVVGHIKIADNITVLAQAGVTRNLEEAGVYSGFPARPNREQLSFDASLNCMVKDYNEKRKAKLQKSETNDQ